MLKAVGRVQVVAANVFREVIRDRVLYFLVIYGVILALAARLLPELSALGTDRKILVDLGLAVMQVLGLVLAIFVGTNLINKEIEKRTLLVLMAKPLSRSEFLIGKHLGLTAVLGVLLAAMTCIYLIVLEVTGTPYLKQPTLITVGFLWLLLSLVTAFAIGFGSRMSSLLATMMTIAVYCMGTLSGDIVALGKLTENPAIMQMTRMIYLVLPDLSRLDLKNQAVYNALPSLAMLSQNALYGILYLVFVLTIASLLFSAREF
jgi:ABC-type transport system involved in multi-copper enzyme maturation permease subunit